MVNLSEAYINDFPCALGRLVGNLTSLEILLRSVLHELRHPPHTPLPAGRRLISAQRGEHVPLNALTSWDSLGMLIAAFNQRHAAPVHVDPTITALRDALAHGRRVANDESTDFVLLRFGRPNGDDVVVEDRVELTIAWLNEQIRRVGDAVDIASRRLRELQAKDARSADGSH